MLRTRKRNSTYTRHRKTPALPTSENMKIIKSVVIGAFFCFLPTLSNAAQLNIAGLVAGEPTTPDAVHDALGLACGEGSQNVQVCNGVSSYASSVGDANVVIGSDGLLDRVYLTVDEDSYDDVVQSLRRQFGSPQRIARSTVQNGFGATFQQESLTWNGPHGTRLYVSRYAADVEHATVLLTSKRDRQSN